MTIPDRFQLFATPVLLSEKDQLRLREYLDSSRVLMRWLSSINEADLQRLIVMELMGERRWTLLDRLIMRLGKAQKRALAEKVRRMCR